FATVSWFLFRCSLSCCWCRCSIMASPSLSWPTSSSLQPASCLGCITRLERARASARTWFLPTFGLSRGGFGAAGAALSGGAREMNSPISEGYAPSHARTPTEPSERSAGGGARPTGAPGPSETPPGRVPSRLHATELSRRGIPHPFTERRGRDPASDLLHPRCGGTR